MNDNKIIMNKDENNSLRCVKHEEACGKNY